MRKETWLYRLLKRIGIIKSYKATAEEITEMCVKARRSGICPGCCDACAWGCMKDDA